MKKILILFLMLTLVACGKENNEEKQTEKKIQYNEKDTIITEQNVDNISFNTTSFYYDGEYSILSLTITNNKEKTVNIGSFDIIVKDVNNKEIGKYESYYSDDIESGSSVNIEISLKQNLISGSSFEYVLNSLEVKE